MQNEFKNINEKLLEQNDVSVFLETVLSFGGPLLRASCNTRVILKKALIATSKAIKYPAHGSEIRTTHSRFSQKQTGL